MLLEGKPLRGRELQNLKDFLQKMDLSYDEGIEYSVCVLDDSYHIIGTGSVDRNVIKCVAVDPGHQGMGISAELLSNLVQYEFEKGRTHLFIYTKPKNQVMFGDMGFYTIFQTEDVLFMENRAKGFANFIETIRKETPVEALRGGSRIGAVVANCNPFTKGHRYLVERALEQCAYLHLFILSDEGSLFSAKERYEMAQRGIEGLQRVVLHRTQDYMISAATFPTYFFKERLQGQRANCRLDLQLFGDRIAPELGITMRFVGSEPFCEVTRSYNETMHEILPSYGIEVVETRRATREGTAISASEVRKYLSEGEIRKIKELVPESVFDFLMNREVAKGLSGNGGIPTM
ncbi:MAG: [citrate (pro-3S)-lyase] ligase [Lachnospiraceae bacterium]|nr:[citrate (pro-3S)-lyase] ligase [Lachnospiraceae bacterium]